MRHCGQKKFRCVVVTAWLAGALATLFSAAPALPAERPEHANVLLAYAQRRLLPSLVDLDESIRSTIQRKSPAPVTFQTEFLDLDGARGAKYEEKLRELLRMKYAGTQIDLIICGTGPALRFLLAHRDDLFPGVPIVFTSVERTTAASLALPPGVTGVWSHIDWRGTLDAALRLQPDTKQVVVVGGTADTDSLWVRRAREAFSADGRGVEFTYLIDLPMDRLLREVAALREGTIIVFFSLLRDGAGHDFISQEVLSRLSYAASVPIYGLSEAQVGAGAIGGRVTSYRAQGVKAAELGLRALRGQPAGPADIVEAESALLFDWRQLKRWGLRADRLPAGSQVRYAPVSAWDVYKWPIIGTATVALVEALLIAGLLIQRAHRRRAESALDERLRFETLLSDVSAILSDLPAGKVEGQIDRALRRLVEGFGVDRASLAQVIPHSGLVRFTHSWARHSIAPAPSAVETEAFPWTVKQAQQGQIVFFGRAADLPPEAAVDRASYRRFGIKSLMAIPLAIGGSVVGLLSCGHLEAEREWPEALVQRLELLGGLFASALSRTQSETAVRESEDRFRLMADQAPVMVWMSDTDGRCTYLNDRWLDFTGRPLSQETGDGWAAGVHPEDLELCLGVYRRAVEERRSFTMEYRLRRADGEYRFILDHGVPRFVHGDEFVGHIGSCVDTTELKSMQQAVQESKALASTIFTSLYGRVAAVDRDGVVIAVNESWERFARESGGEPGQSAVGESYLEALRGAVSRGDGELGRAVEAVESVLDGRERQAVFEYARPASEGARWYEMAVERLRRPQGGAIISHVDVTQRRRAEEEVRRQGAELAHALRVATMGELAGSLAHEINQPLAVIVTNAQAAQRLLESGRPDRGELRGALTDIADQGMHAARVIGRLRALFRKAEPERQRLDVGELIRGVASLVRHDVERREIAMALRCAPGLPLVSGDSIHLQQVVLNLLLNACEAMATVDPPRDLIVATRGREGDGVELLISDTGPGLKESERERIFEPFVTTKPAGLGMGLSISRSIIHAHGGRIWVACNPDRGITVHVELPLGASPRHRTKIL